MKITNLKQNLLYVTAIGFGIFALFFVVTCSWIGYEVKDLCQQAKKDYPTVTASKEQASCVDALIMLLTDTNQGFRPRNDAIWALGQLGDSRALPVLQSFYTGEIPPKEPLNKVISQYELKKAINLTSGGFNLGAIVWRNQIIKNKSAF